MELKNSNEELNNSDLISRQATIDAILAVTGNTSVRELYEHVQEHGLSDMWSGGVNAAIDIIIAVPSAHPDVPDTNVGDMISRADVIELVKNSYYNLAESMEDTWAMVADVEKLPPAQPEITLLQATKTALEFMELCGGTTAFLITPDGEKLLCDWGYVEEGLRELVRYAERRTDG